MAILKEAGIGTLVDVRAYPASRRHPQYNKEKLRVFLEGAGIAYRWEGKALGGMRPSYADHMQTEQFQTAARALSPGQPYPAIVPPQTPSSASFGSSGKGNSARSQ